MRDRRGPTESPNTALGEPAGVADLDEQLGNAARFEPNELPEGGSGALDQLRQVRRDLALAPIELEDVTAAFSSSCTLPEGLGNPLVGGSGWDSAPSATIWRRCCCVRGFWRRGWDSNPRWL
jgi:hypothetical protein